MTTDDPFDTLLAEALAPPPGPADRLFVARAQAAIAEAERFRRWRRRALSQLGSEALVLFGLAGAALTLAQIPMAREVLTSVPFAAPSAASAVLLAWLLLARQRGPAVFG